MRVKYITRNVAKKTKIQCGICLNRVTRNSTISIVNCVGCHSYCTDCMKSYIISKIGDGLLEMPCPHVNCSGYVSDDEIVQLCDKESLHQYKRLFTLKKPRNKVCQSCNRILRYHKDEKIITCTCGVSSCFTHGLAHQGRLCEDFNENELTSQTIRQTCKVCPGCNVNVEKSCGCNHMVIISY